MQSFNEMQINRDRQNYQAYAVFSQRLTVFLCYVIHDDDDDDDDDAVI